jgi:hypothetical protein
MGLLYCFERYKGIILNCTYKIDQNKNWFF